jgi:hypothetical protein
LSITEIRLLSGCFSRESERKQKGKRQKHSPFEGVEGGCSVSVKKASFYGVYQFWYILFGKIEIKLLSLPKNKDYGSIEFYIKRISEPAGSRV